MEVIVLIWVVCGLAGGMIGAQKGEPVVGFILGLLIGPLGELVVLRSSGKGKTCPYCKEMVKRGATICKHCRQPIPE